YYPSAPAHTAPARARRYSSRPRDGLQIQAPGRGRLRGDCASRDEKDPRRPRAASGNKGGPSTAPAVDRARDSERKAPARQNKTSPRRPSSSLRSSGRSQPTGAQATAAETTPNA